MPAAFRLSTVLKLREAARNERRAHLAEAYRAEELLRRRLGELEQNLAELKHQYRQTIGQGALDVDRLIDAQRYELLLRAEQTAMQGHEQTLSAEIERRRETLVAADRDVRVLEMLRERKQEEEQSEEERLAAKDLDEAALRQYRAEEA